jgi:ADP-ribosylation factor-like protein 6
LRAVNNVKFTVNDMSGRDGYRSMWEPMYAQCDAIVFVLDSTDQLRFAVVKDELDMMLRHPDVAARPGLPILFVANKAAAPDACSASTVAGALALHERIEPDRPWRLATTDAAAAPGQPVDDGLREAVEWLVDTINVTDRR